MRASAGSSIWTSRSGSKCSRDHTPRNVRMSSKEYWITEIVDEESHPHNPALLSEVLDTEKKETLGETSEDQASGLFLTNPARRSGGYNEIHAEITSITDTASELSFTDPARQS